MELQDSNVITKFTSWDVENITGDKYIKMTIIVKWTERTTTAIATLNMIATIQHEKQ